MISEKTRKKLSEVHTNPSGETRRRLSESKTGEKNHRFGTHPTLETRTKNSEAIKELWKDPEYRRRITESGVLFGDKPSWNKGKTGLYSPSDESREKNRKANTGKKRSEKTCQKHREDAKKQFEDPNQRELRRALRMGTKFSVETCRKLSERQVGEKNCNWKGGVSKSRRKIYCEKWCLNLWRRIDAAQNNQSILSGKTKEDNDGYALSRHHVYWQEKACCVWDEDVQGYYAMIDIGTIKNPQPYKHYIKGDPNKFVLLTKKEHGLIKGNKKLGTSKLTWIKILEDLIETKLGGKCYFTDEEMENYTMKPNIFNQQNVSTCEQIGIV